MINRNKYSTNKRMFFLFPILYSILTFVYVLYSYTQIDLGLTLSQAGFLPTIQRQFQQIGFFNRPFSTLLFCLIVITLCTLYGFVLIKAYKKKLDSKQFWIIIAVLSISTIVAYPAFSYDFFNYLFTAKTVLIYHKNPYIVIPLQFAGVDPWLSFMHWTHLPSAYTPLWIISTLVPYVFGFGKLALLIINLKIYITLAYVATTYGIGKILESRGTHVSQIGMAIFALNPLVITECLISPHNDVVMMAIAIWAIVLYQRSEKWISWLLLSLSVAMKLMTIFLLPVFFFKWNRYVALVSMCVALAAVLLQREILSWYWVWIIPFIALLPERPNLVVVSTGVSLGLLLRYAPFLYLGHWDAPAPLIKVWVTLVPIVLSVVIAFTMHYKKKYPTLIG